MVKQYFAKDRKEVEPKREKPVKVLKFAEDVEDKQSYIRDNREATPHPNKNELDQMKEEKKEGLSFTTKIALFAGVVAVGYAIYKKKQQ